MINLIRGNERTPACWVSTMEGSGRAAAYVSMRDVSRATMKRVLNLAIVSISHLLSSKKKSLFGSEAQWVDL